MAGLNPEAAREALEHHVGKWHRREPEMLLAEPFCPAALRSRFRAWGALLFELREAAFELSDARVTAVKTTWWAEELDALAQGRGRHALTLALEGTTAPWRSLARALLDVIADEPLASDPEAAVAALRPLGGAVLAVEAGLFGSGTQGADAVAAHFLLERLPRGLAAEDRARLPLNLLARHGTSAAQLAAGEGGAVVRDWAGELAQRLPAARLDASLYRRLRLAFDRARVERIAAGRGFGPPPAPATLWRAWRVARGA